MDVVPSWTGGRADKLRQALRMTNESFAEHLGVAVRTVAYWRKRSDMVPQPAIQEALDAALVQTSDSIKTQFRLLLDEDENRISDARETPNLANSASGITAWLTATNATDDAIEEISQTTHSLAEMHTQLPAAKALADVLRLHQQTLGILRSGKQRLRQTRELFRIESNLLAHACLLFGDLNQNEVAAEYGRAALAYATEAETNEAIAWSARAKTARWQERYSESADLAQRGFECSPLTPIRVQLAYQEANAAALLGDVSRARRALKRGEEAAAQVAPDAGVSAWSFPTGRQAIFSLSVAIHTGDPDTALRAAEMADDGWTAGEPLVPATWAQIKAGAGIAHLMNDALDGALEQVTPMLSLAPELRLSTVTGYLTNLDRRLRQPRFLRSSSAVDLRNQIREFNAGAPPKEDVTVEE